MKVYFFIGKCLFYLIFFSGLKGCSEGAVNPAQYKASLDNIECYNSLITLIRKDSVFFKTLKTTRDSKIRGDVDPIFIKGVYRQIDYLEISNLLENSIDSVCIDKFRNKNDLDGIRLIDKDLVIVEIDKFSRYTLKGKLTSKGTVEFHRIIYSTSKPDLKRYSFGGEREILYEKITANCYYQVTQVEKRHGIFY